MGFFYDLFGRRWVMGFSYLLMCVGLFVIPSFLQNDAVMLSMRIMIAVALTAVITSPLISDFIEKDGRGKGAGIQIAGGQTGEVVSFALMMEL